MTSQRIGKYACLEVECRYLLHQIPDDLLDSAQGWLIKDRYILNTRLRLRHMRSISGNTSVYKLTQKYRSELQNEYETTITTLYLTEAEFSLFTAFEARILNKKRYPYTVQHKSFSIDVFDDRHQGLILAELEMEKREAAEGVVLPSFVLKDVTNDPFFAGSNLAAMTRSEFRQGLSLRLRDHESL